MLSHRGTFEFFAPECFKQQGKGTTYYSGRKADVWALGLCIYALAFNDLPFVMGQGAETRYAHADMEDLDQKIDKEPKSISDGLRNFLKKALQLDPEKRASVFEL